MGTGNFNQQPGEGVASSSKAGCPVIETSNVYESLSEDDDDDGSEGEGDGDLPVLDTAKVKLVTKEKRQPPIVCPNTLASLVDSVLMKAGCGFVLTLKKEATIVTTFNSEEYGKVLAALKAGNINYYTHDPPDKVPVKIVLSGYVPKSIPELMDDLAVFKINPREARVLSRKTTATGEHLLYLLYFDRGSTKIQDLRKVNSLNGFLVKWRFFAKQSSDVAQCHRCQRFGHGSRGCTMTPQCVKCGAAHLTGECTLPKKAILGVSNNAEQHKQKVKCANCNGNHTANYRGCTARKTYVEVLEKQRKKPATQQPPRPTNTTQHPTGERPAPPGWGRTYASVAAPASRVSASPVVDAEDDGFTLTEFLGLARGLFTSFREHRSKEQQFWALTDLMGKYLSK